MRSTWVCVILRLWTAFREVIVCSVVCKLQSAKEKNSLRFWSLRTVIKSDWESEKGSGVIHFTDQDYPERLGTDVKQDNPVPVLDGETLRMAGYGPYVLGVRLHVCQDAVERAVSNLCWAKSQPLWAAGVKITSSDIPDLLNYFAVFILCVCVIYKCCRRPHNTIWLTAD
jgi:hypothetical protein